MSPKSKFHLTLVILITMCNSLFGTPGVSDIEKANALDIKNQAMYNKNISNIYNNINIKYISIKLYNININSKLFTKNVNTQKQKLNRALGYKEKVEILMYSIKQVESNGRYKAKSKWSSACGAYQYLTITWNNYEGFRNACLAPEWVQDKRMRGQVNYLWKKYGDWDKVIAAHYSPAYAGNKSKWDKSWSGLSIREYVKKVNDRMDKIVVGLATT